MAVQIFLVQLFCAVFSCAGRHPSPVPESRSLATAYSHNLEAKGPPVIQTQNGFIQGTYMRTIKDREIAAFMAIPYAKSPVGDLRFRDPVPSDPWDGYLRTDQPGPACLQVDASQFYLVMGQEEGCLHLSVYTPKINGILDGEKPLPVIFFVHGGGYFFGSSNLWGPAYILDRDVILVTVNFRQGVLGFLSTGDSVAPGNFGLKDQALALQWVADNIHNFGGDANRITVMGVASGAAIANLNLISKQTRDLVANVILHSGSAHQHWSVLTNRTIENSKKVALSFNCPIHDSYAMVKCLRSQNPHFVANALQKAFEIHTFPWVNFGPVIESPSPTAFLEESVFDAYARGHVKRVPCLGGIVESEGDVFVHTLLKIIWKKPVLQDLNKRWYEVAPLLFDYHETAVNPDEVSTQIKEYYLQNEPINFVHRDRISRAIGDRYITEGTVKGLQIHSRIAPTYGYFFDYNGRPSVTTTLKFKRKDWPFPTHTDDLAYLLNSTLLYSPLKTSDPEFRISEFMTEAWVNFAHYGKPFVSTDRVPWSPIGDPLNMEVLEINTDRRMILFPYKQRMDFWQSLQLQGDYSLYPIPPAQKYKRNKT